ncbi:ribonuclease Y [candidate division WWE3 bacterium RIFOXYC1_FULL_39_7]|uniref:Ribonuclease Y n=2 Tax=Katanobacteria TaxID=422282 RepID=A0A1F4X7D7_UNCKA|nr:MAG: ribonuclease Y [candidate division WWE3 bacterium RIFOXYC1_FULL_39_7]OGC77461.1 MAG: ribonuclease Y [candidate division WWE3 bacterium RIFOXYD1_FULL_39_9]
MDNMFLALLVFISSLGSALLVQIMNRKKVLTSTSEKSEEPRAISDDSATLEARAQAKEIIVEAKGAALKIRTEAEDEVRRIKENALELEKRLAVQKTQIEGKDRDIENKLRTLKQAKELLDKKQEDVEKFYSKQQEELQKISNLTKDEAKQMLLSTVDKELAEEKGRRIREMDEEIKKNSETTAQEILVSAMRFAATDYIVEYTTSKVKLPDDDIKGRIIGKEGRNIRTFEEKTGVDLDLDSSPGDVIISSFDPVRREIAKVSLEKLITDGRIQPAHIEEVVEKTKTEIEHLMYKEGDNLAHKIGAYNLPKDLIQMLGRFKYRFSYGQNMIEHTLEETRLGVAIAHELNANVEIVRMGCLFHDIGKVVTDDEGTHIQLGVDLLRKYKISDDVVNCVAEHHEDRPFSSIESAIVNLSDHISGARPGARSEDYEAYVQRLKDLEAAALSFDGIDKAYAVSAGREVRVFVSPEKVDDASTAYLAREIAKKIELEQTYPGVVKVTVIRETRVTETAK